MTVQHLSVEIEPGHKPGQGIPHLQYTILGLSLSAQNSAHQVEILDMAAIGPEVCEVDVSGVKQLPSIIIHNMLHSH